MTYKRRPSYIAQIAMGAGMAGRIYPLICTVRMQATGHSTGVPVINTSGMRIVRPGARNDTFNAEAVAVHFLRPAIATGAAESRYYFSVDRQGDTLGMECMGDQQYGPIPIHPDVQYVSFFSVVGTESIAGGWVVSAVHDSLNF